MMMKVLLVYLCLNQTFFQAVASCLNYYYDSYTFKTYKYNFEDKKAYINSIETNTTVMVESSNNIFDFDASRLNFIEERFYKTISIGDNHTLALKPDGTLWAWGNNESAQLGDGSTLSTYEAIKISTNTYKAISVGKNLCILKVGKTINADAKIHNSP